MHACAPPKPRSSLSSTAVSFSPSGHACRWVGFKDCRNCMAQVYQFVFGFGLSSIGGFILGFWLGTKLLYRK